MLKQMASKVDRHDADVKTTDADVKSIDIDDQTNDIEGRYIRRSTTYIRHRRSIHTPLNELHMSSKVDTMIFLSR